MTGGHKIMYLSVLQRLALQQRLVGKEQTMELWEL